MMGNIYTILNKRKFILKPELSYKINSKNFTIKTKKLELEHIHNSNFPFPESNNVSKSNKSNNVIFINNKSARYELEFEYFAYIDNPLEYSLSIALLNTNVINMLNPIKILLSIFPINPQRYFSSFRINGDNLEDLLLELIISKPVKKINLNMNTIEEPAVVIDNSYDNTLLSEERKINSLVIQNIRLLKFDH